MMHRGAMQIDGDGAVLRLDFETSFGIDAGMIARVFQALETAFNEFQSPTPADERLSLRLFALRHGSVIAEFVVVAAAGVTLWDFRKAAIEFAASLLHGLNRLLGREPGEVKKEEEELLASIIEIVSWGDATRITIQVVGDNEIIIIIDEEISKEYLAHQRAIAKKDDDSSVD